VPREEGARDARVLGTYGNGGGMGGAGGAGDCLGGDALAPDAPTASIRSDRQASVTVRLAESTLAVGAPSVGLACCTAGLPTSIGAGPTRERSTGRKTRPWAMPKTQMPKNCLKKTVKT